VTAARTAGGEAIAVRADTVEVGSRRGHPGAQRVDPLPRNVVRGSELEATGWQSGARATCRFPANQSFCPSNDVVRT
jgi:hypothetical protein